METPKTKRTPEEKRAAQAAAHRKWRHSAKGEAYEEKRRLKAAIANAPVNNEPPSGS